MLQSPVTATLLRSAYYSNFVGLLLLNVLRYGVAAAANRSQILEEEMLQRSCWLKPRAARPKDRYVSSLEAEVVKWAFNGTKMLFKEERTREDCRSIKLRTLGRHPRATLTLSPKPPQLVPPFQFSLNLRSTKPHKS
jgi:hypothetical protein